MIGGFQNRIKTADNHHRQNNLSVVAYIICIYKTVICDSKQKGNDLSKICFFHYCPVLSSVKLSEHDILGLLISKFTDSSVNLSNRPVCDAKGNVIQPALDNHTMGTVFEEVIRKFNEETNITDAGRHFTPRDIVELITDLAFVPVKERIKSDFSCC